MSRYFYAVPRALELADFYHDWQQDTVSDIRTCAVPLNALPTDLMKLAIDFKGVPLLFYFPPRTCYTWHTDRLRKCALNYEYSPGVTLFGQQVPSEKAYTELKQVPYNGGMALLDTTYPHLTYNLTDGPRVLFSLGFNSTPFSVIKAQL